LKPNRTQPGRWGRLLVILALVTGGVLLVRFTLFRPKLVPVTVHRVEAGRVEDTVVNSRAGTVESRRRAGMSPGLPGLVTAVAVRKGARVKQDEVLLRLDDSEHQAGVLLARRSVEVAQALAEQARLEARLAEYVWQRTRNLARDQVVSETALEQERTRSLTAESVTVGAVARIREAEAALAAAQATLDKTIIRAPFDGVVLDVTAEVGEWISPAPPGVFIPPVVDLIALDALYVNAPIDEADVARIRTGLPVRITLDAFRGQAFDGTLTYLSSFVESKLEQNRTLLVEAEFQQTSLPAGLLPGLSADVEVILDAREKVLRVPTYALLEGGRVLVVDAGRLVERQVTTGLRNWSFTEIESGLTAGEGIVVSLDRPEVKAGARAEPKEEAPR
jgi:HlyD family secretion protein